MNLTYIITSLANSLNSEFFQCHVTIYDLFQSLDGSIHRTITTRTSFKLLTGNIQSQTSNRTYTDTTCHLQILQLNTMILAAVCSCQYQYIIIIDIFFLIGQFQKLLIYLIQFFLIQVNSQQRQAILQCRTSATGSQYDRVIIDAFIMRIDNLVSFYILQHTILMDTR